jgi:ubiquinone/menaquinone biosynthesis C-methylase UbiE
MSTKLTLEQIEAYWKSQAVNYGEEPEASWSDVNVIQMEIAAVSKWLVDGDLVLDAGCANGYSTVKLARSKQITIKGLDFIPEMIEYARQRAEKSAPEVRSRLSFDVGDITALSEGDSLYDKVVVVRVLINLRTWERQKQALAECIRVLKPGGTLLISEATLQGWHNMNKFRKEWNLPEIPMPGFNEYIDEELLINGIQRDLRLVEVCNFSSTYFVGTRIIKPLLAQVVGGSINIGDPNMEWNRFCAALPAFGDYGTQKLFIFRKS